MNFSSNWETFLKKAIWVSFVVWCYHTDGCQFFCFVYFPQPCGLLQNWFGKTTTPWLHALSKTFNYYWTAGSCLTLKALHWSTQKANRQKTTSLCLNASTWGPKLQSYAVLVPSLNWDRGVTQWQGTKQYFTSFAVLVSTISVQSLQDLKSEQKCCPWLTQWAGSVTATGSMCFSSNISLEIRHYLTSFAEIV